MQQMEDFLTFTIVAYGEINRSMSPVRFSMPVGADNKKLVNRKRSQNIPIYV